jgi:hypothetical protein
MWGAPSAAYSSTVKAGRSPPLHETIDVDSAGPAIAKEPVAETSDDCAVAAGLVADLRVVAWTVNYFVLLPLNRCLLGWIY